MTLADRGPDGGVPGRLAAWLATLGPLAGDRPAPALGQAVAGVGGALVAAGVVGIGAERWTSSDSSAQGVVLCALLLVGSVAAMVRTPPPWAVAGVAASGVAAPALAFFLTAGDGFPSLRGIAVVTGALLACLYGLGPWRGHSFHLSILVAAGWLLALTSGNAGLGRGGGLSTIASTITSAGAGSMAVGVVYLGLGSWLHDEGLRGVATPFLAVAALALPLGAVAVARDASDPVQGAVAVVTGAAVAFVGGRSRRRGTTWIGVGIVAVGVVTLSGGITDSTVGIALLVMMAGAALVAGAPAAASAVGETPAPDAEEGG